MDPEGNNYLKGSYPLLASLKKVLQLVAILHTLKGMSIFEKESVMVVFTTSPAGLGHVRVMQALRGGLPEGIRSEIIGIDDPKVQFLHRITSRNHRMLHILEFAQMNKTIEDVFTKWYTKRIRANTGEIYSRLTDLITRRRPVPKTVVIVSTHVSLAHQVASVKKDIEKNLGVRILFVTVVTDDTKQKIWAVWGSDLLFVPSEFIKEWMEKYLHTLSLSSLPTIIVNPYPVSPLLSKKLEKIDVDKKCAQVGTRKKKRMRIILPISGAAVQLSFLKDVITALTRKNHADITIVARDSSYTKPFLRWCAQNEHVHVLADTYDWDVVASYEYAYRRNVFALEVSKPSEQAFKVLLDPAKRGGVIMLFSTPVGSQEYDNVAFLKRHGFIPSDEDTTILEKLYTRNKKEEITDEFLSRAKNWRGIMLPYSGTLAGRAILRLKKAGVFQAMMEYRKKDTELEVKDNGVELFWNRIEKEILRLS